MRKKKENQKQQGLYLPATVIEELRIRAVLAKQSISKYVEMTLVARFNAQPRPKI